MTFGNFFKNPTPNQANVQQPAGYQPGISNLDDGRILEQGATLPWFINPGATWFDYRCWVECILDSGIVLHKPLPQGAQSVDTLASVLADPVTAVVNNETGINLPDFTTQNVDQYVRGVNTVGNGQYTDYLQRMATSDYTFVLRGFGLRAGYQVPVPGLKSVAGITAVPTRQWSLGNPIVANYGGIPVFYNAWELWYLVAVPPKQDQLPPPNVAQHIRADVELPKGIQVPFSQTDSNSIATPPPGNKQQEFVVPAKL